MYTLFQNQETVFETKSLKSAGSSLSAVYFHSFLCVFFSFCFPMLSLIVTGTGEYIIKTMLAKACAL